MFPIASDDADDACAYASWMIFSMAVCATVRMDMGMAMIGKNARMSNARSQPY